MAIPITIDKIKEKIFHIHGNIISLDETTYKNSYTKARFIDLEYGVWYSEPRKIYSGHGHPSRGIKNRSIKNTISLNEILQKINALYGNTVVMKMDTYTHNNRKSVFIDGEYGEWISTPLRVVKGFGHPQRSYDSFGYMCRIKIENIIEILKKIHNNSVKILPETYCGVAKKATFIHETEGEWISIVSTVLSGGSHPIMKSKKIKETCLKRYGVKNVNQHPEIAKKNAKNQSKSIVKYHWKTDQELICQGSYEAKTVDYFNTNKIEFEWQSKIFTMPSGKTYRPDCYLIKENKRIEIKGYMRKDAQEKWDWFKSEYPTAELWNKEKLKLLGVL